MSRVLILSCDEHFTSNETLSKGLIVLGGNVFIETLNLNSGKSLLKTLILSSVYSFTEAFRRQQQRRELFIGIDDPQQQQELYLGLDTPQRQEFARSLDPEQRRELYLNLDRQQQRDLRQGLNFRQRLKLVQGLDFRQQRELYGQQLKRLWESLHTSVRATEPATS